MPRVSKIAGIEDGSGKAALQSSLFGNSGNFGNCLTIFPSVRPSDPSQAVNCRVCEL